MGRSGNYKKQKYFKYAALTLSIIFVISCAMFCLSLWEKQQGRLPEYDLEETIIEFDGQEYVLKDNVEAFLILGLDQTEDTIASASYNSNQSADFLMLFVFDNDAKKCSAIQINRDTVTDVNVLDLSGNKVSVVTKQIALAHSYGNSPEIRCHNTMNAVSTLLLDSKINHYVSLTMDAVSLINDLVGGVEVTVMHDFKDVDDTLQKGETVILNGEQALNYVRSRSGLDENDNISRMERQKQYMNALYNKIIERIESDEEFIVELFTDLSKNIGAEQSIDSDRSVTQLRELAKKFVDYEFTGIYNIEGESKVGEQFMEFYADVDSIKELVIENFYEAKR